MNDNVWMRHSLTASGGGGLREMRGFAAHARLSQPTTTSLRPTLHFDKCFHVVVKSRSSRQYETSTRRFLF